MPKNLIKKKGVLFGAGAMAQDYAKVLQELSATFTVVGRSVAATEKFFKKTGIQALPNGFAAWKKLNPVNIEYAIIAVSVEELARTAIELIDFGIRNILLEKPGGLNPEEIQKVRDKSEKTGTRVLIAYNRRFYASVLKAQEIIAQDGGVRSFSFDFTEWPHMICDNPRFSSEVKENWFLACSSHVVDLAFFLGGKPKELKTFVAGGLDWHPSASSFAGAGITDKGALFSYHANWDAPGRWGVNILTEKHRLIFRPLEKLRIQKLKSISEESVEIDDTLDTKFKPGLYLQTLGFLEGGNQSNSIDINEHCNNVFKHFIKIMSPGKHN
jgi:predicted dehydrogenase